MFLSSTFLYIYKIIAAIGFINPNLLILAGCIYGAQFTVTQLKITPSTNNLPGQRN